MFHEYHEVHFSTTYIVVLIFYKMRVNIEKNKIFARKGKIMGKHNVSRIKYLPEKEFYLLWHSVKNYSSKNDYVSKHLSPLHKERFDFKKYDIPPSMSIDLLSNIYDMYNLSINDIIKASGLKRASFGYRYCIPIRTLEEWCKKDTSPDYVRLFILKEIGLFKLPKYLHIGVKS